MTEDDTFNALHRRPINEVVNDWSGQGNRLLNVRLPAYVAKEKYTLEEFLNAWYVIHEDYYSGPKQSWALKYLQYHEQHRRRNI